MVMLIAAVHCTVNLQIGRAYLHTTKKNLSLIVLCLVISLLVPRYRRRGMHASGTGSSWFSRRTFASPRHRSRTEERGGSRQGRGGARQQAQRVVACMISFSHFPSIFLSVM